MTALTCERCGKVIRGKSFVLQHRKKLGSKSVLVTEYYDEDCFKAKSKERGLNECRKKKANCSGCNKK